MGLGNTLTHPIAYLIIQIQVDGVLGYNEDQMALVIPDLSNFVAWVPIIPGNPHNRPHHECDKGEGDRCTGDPLGQCPSSLPFDCSVSYCHGGR